MLFALNNFFVENKLPSSSIDLPRQESMMELLMLLIRALMMRRNLNKGKSFNDDIKTWQDSFLQFLFSFILQLSNASDETTVLSLATVAKHVQYLSCEHQDSFLSDSSSNTSAMMWRQKLWHKCFPILTSAADTITELSSDEDVIHPTSILLCICGLAAEMPLAVVKEHMPQLITFSIQALMVNSPDASANFSPASNAEVESLISYVRTYSRHAAVQCLLSACQSTDETIIECLSSHMTTLVPLLLQV